MCLRKRMALGKALLDALRGFKTQLGPTSGQLGPNLAPTWLRNRSQKAPQDLKIWRANIVTENDCNFDPKIIAFCDDFWSVLWLPPKSFFCSVTRSGCPKNIQKHIVFEGVVKIGFHTDSVTVSWKLTSRGLEISGFSQVDAGMDFCPILAWFWSRFRVPNRCQNGPEKG